MLLILFQLKHYLADYPLQTEYMLGKFSEDDWVLPLLAHSSVHGFFTMIILLPFVSTVAAISLALFDMVVHFIMDRIKASPFLLGRYQPQEKAYWNVLGLDQLVHHLTHYAIILITLILVF
jgi:hypothetical protein